MQVEKGKFVKLCYTGRYEDGEIFDQTSACQAIEIEIGAGEVVPGFEDALIGMAPSEKRTFTLGPDQAYGDRDERLQRKIGRSNFPTGYQPQVGEVIAFRTPVGEQLPAMVKDADSETVTVDFNHPLAGKSLTFEVEVAEVNDQRSPTQSTCSSGCCCS
jgi:peptidylprolyl isomerase